MAAAADRGPAVARGRVGHRMTMESESLMRLPPWVSLDPAKAFFAAEQRLSPRLEAALRTDAALDTLAVAFALRRLLGRAADGVANRVVEIAGLPSSRQLRQLQASLDALDRASR